MQKTSKIFTILLSAIMVLSFSSCHDNWGIKGEGPVTEEMRALPEFHSVNVSVPADVSLSQGRQKEVALEAQENILQILKTEVNNGVLEISFGENVGRHEDIKISLTIPEYRQVVLSGSGSVKTENRLRGDELDLHISGSGNMDIQAKYERVKTNIAGSGDINLSGRGQFLEVNIAGSGNVRALDFETEESEVKVTGSGDGETEVKDRLEVSIMGSGDVKYRGRPVIESKTSGSGSVSSVD